MAECKSESSEFLAILELALRADGFDLVLPCGLAGIRGECQQLGLSLPARSNPLGVLVGNSSALWPRFLAELHSNPALRQLEHPLDAWVEQRVLLAVAGVEPRATPYFAHRQLTLGYLPLQHWAQQLGVLALSPSHLSVHRDYGPWLALRALVVIDAEAGPEHVFLPETEPCGSCSGPCRIPFEQAALASAQLAGTRRVTDHWQQWLAVRDACPLGKQYRYSEPQILYHYARDRAVLGG